MKITDKIITENFNVKRPLGRYLLKENIKIDLKIKSSENIVWNYLVHK
jgi:hypothetical protein